MGISVPISPFCSPYPATPVTNAWDVLFTIRAPENRTILFKFKNDTHLWPLWTNVAHALAYLVSAADVSKRATVETTMSGVPAAAAIASRTWPLSDKTTRLYRTSSCDSYHWYDVNQLLLPRLAISHTQALQYILRGCVAVQSPICKPVYVYFAKGVWT